MDNLEYKKVYLWQQGFDKDELEQSSEDEINK